jgi:hypothetical protein
MKKNKQLERAIKFREKYRDQAAERLRKDPNNAELRKDVNTLCRALLRLYDRKSGIKSDFSI